MELHTMHPIEGARTPRKRKGRGPASGTGKTAGRGHKGQKARSGGGVRPGFEGGQTPLFRRIPKRGFHNRTRVEYTIVNIRELNVFDEQTVITPDVLLEKRIIRGKAHRIKILGQGLLKKPLIVHAHRFSARAQTAIEKAGGSVQVI